MESVQQRGVGGMGSKPIAFRLLVASLWLSANDVVFADDGVFAGAGCTRSIKALADQH